MSVAALPIYEVISELKEMLRTHSIAILEAPPGAGKSTVLPLTLLDEAWLQGKKILVLEPRRLAAKGVTQRMSDLLGEPIGSKVGYRIRFESCVNKDTRIEVVTEGILTRMLQSDNALEGVGLVIFDEFHERSLNADLALALCLQCQQILRNDLKLLIMSATIDSQGLSTLLKNAPVIHCSGKQFSVAINFAREEPKGALPLEMAEVIQKAFSANKGDVLAFLPGAGEIIRCKELLDQRSLQALVLPLYGDLSPREQQQALLPDASGRRKIVLATSIAETSLTIEGITTVVDSGYARLPRFDLRTGLSRLETVRITKDAATQRTGRAGRLQAGTCYRLWTEGTHAQLKAQRVPEIVEADLAPLLLELAQWGIQNSHELTWITPPSENALNQARALLEGLGAIANGRITERGKEMIALPTHPRIAHMLIEAHDKALACDLAALLEERDPLNKEAGADMTLRVDALRKWRNKEEGYFNKSGLERIERVSLAYRKLLKVAVSNVRAEETEVGLLLAAAYPERIAKRLQKDSCKYRLANGRIVNLKESDALCSEEWLTVAHLDVGGAEGKLFLAAPLDPMDLLDRMTERIEIIWNKSKEAVVGRLVTSIDALEVESSILKTIPEDQKVAVLCDAIRKEGLQSMLHWSDAAIRLQQRIGSLRVWRPHELWPTLSTDYLSEHLEDWLAPFLGPCYKKDDLLNLNLALILESLLPHELRVKLDVCAPDKIEVPSGSTILLNYFEDGRSPELAVRLQEVFGMTVTPVVNEGKVSVLMQLLSPARRPVQVTQDLHSFWKNTYGAIRKELKIRYPKHSWPEDPWTAKAVRGVVKKRL